MTLGFWVQQALLQDNRLQPTEPGACPSMSLTDQNFGGWIVDPDGLQDGGSVVGDRHRPTFPSTQQDLILGEDKKPQRMKELNKNQPEDEEVLHHPPSPSVLECSSPDLQWRSLPRTTTEARKKEALL